MTGPRSSPPPPKHVNGAPTYEYLCWKNLKKHCANPARNTKGLTVQWLSFEDFYRDMGPRPSFQHKLRRKDTNAGYFKENCFWGDQNASDHPEYNLWSGMKKRCENPDSADYNRYGGRGISVCSRWNSFWNFIEDMGPRPSPNHSVERINNNGNYEPDNCCWATPREQSRNTRSNTIVDYNGEKMCLIEAAEQAGIPYDVVANRVSVDWSFEKALSTPVGKSTRTKRLFEFEGQLRTLRSIARITGISHSTLYKRVVKLGLNLDEALCQ